MGVAGIIKALDRRGRRAVKLVTANLIHVTQLIHKKVKVNTDKFYYNILLLFFLNLEIGFISMKKTYINHFQIKNVRNIIMGTFLYFAFSETTIDSVYTFDF